MKKLIILILIALSVGHLAALWSEEIGDPSTVDNNWARPITFPKSVQTGLPGSSTLSQVQAGDMSILYYGRDYYGKDSEADSKALSSCLLLHGTVLQDLHGYYAEGTEQIFLLTDFPCEPEEMMGTIRSMDSCFIYARESWGDPVFFPLYDEVGDPVEWETIAVCNMWDCAIIPIRGGVIDTDAWDTLGIGEGDYTYPLEKAASLEELCALLLERSDPDYEDRYFQHQRELEQATYRTALVRRRNLTALYAICISILLRIYLKVLQRSMRDA